MTNDLRHDMLVPAPWYGLAADIKNPEILWLKDLPRDTFCALWVGWPSTSGFALPHGYNTYIVSFHLEAVDVNWILNQAGQVDGKIIVLADSKQYNFTWPDNVYYFTYYHWHFQLELIKKWFPVSEHQQQKITHKASAFCNRITQSKLLIFTALLEYMHERHVLVKLGNWLEGKNVHHGARTGNDTVDQLTDLFFRKYFGKKYSIDQFENKFDNTQSFTANPWTVAYQAAALHFTNESFHYSLINDCILPGPFLTEKTLKCLAGGTGFVAVGQFDTYNTLSDLGFDFAYKFDTSWDSDPGNISRLASIIDLIKYLSKFDANEILSMTANSSKHNFDHVWSGKFYDICAAQNQKTINQLMKTIK